MPRSVSRHLNSRIKRCVFLVASPKQVKHVAITVITLNVTHVLCQAENVSTIPFFSLADQMYIIVNRPAVAIFFLQSSAWLHAPQLATIGFSRFFFFMLIGHFLLTLLKIRQSLFPLKRSIGHRSIPARRNVNEIDERSHLHFPSFLYFASFRMPPALLHRKGPSSSRDSQRIPSENVWKREWSPPKCFFRHPPVSDPFRSTKWKQILRIHSSGLQKQRGKGLK